MSSPEEVMDALLEGGTVVHDFTVAVHPEDEDAVRRYLNEKVPDADRVQIRVEDQFAKGYPTLLIPVESNGARNVTPLDEVTISARMMAERLHRMVLVVQKERGGEEQAQWEDVDPEARECLVESLRRLIDEEKIIQAGPANAYLHDDGTLA
jgi:hypothetical protein